MTGRKRDRLEIIYDLLNIIMSHHNSIKATPMLRESALSSERFSEYYDELLNKDFIKEIDDGSKKYITLTDKGFKYLEKYKMVLGLIDEFEL